MRILHAIIVHGALLGITVDALGTPPPVKPRADDSTTSVVVSIPGSTQAAEELPDFIPGAYIVELDDDNTDDGDVDAAASFYRTLADEDGIEVEHRMDLSSRLFKGASFQVRDVTTTKRDGNREQRTPLQLLAQIKAKPRVKNAWPVRIVKLKEPRASSGGRAGFPLTAAAAATSLAKKRDGNNNNTTDAEDTFSPHIATQIDKLRGEGITGKGIRIAIVDSGVDWKHPALGACFGTGSPACVVEAGYDFTGDDFLPPGTPQPDDDPYDDCVGHGTHVAGIIAAQLQGNEYGFTGAAPGARLAAYRAWGCRATSTTEILIQAFVRAWEDGADVISCSDGECVVFYLSNPFLGFLSP